MKPGSGKTEAVVVAGLVNSGWTIIVVPTRELGREQVLRLEKLNVKVITNVTDDDKSYNALTYEEAEPPSANPFEEPTYKGVALSLINCDADFFVTTPECLYYNIQVQSALARLRSEDKISLFVVDEASSSCVNPEEQTSKTDC
mmetsp:Transcript_6486/g.8393  ORF Transcript_6486/g.8393 Transcript_6486/m.8393 type:complete len:144 (-) Transcript_6486:73-504(-)